MTEVITSDGVRLYAEATGCGLPVLFIHEFAADHRAWSRQVDALSGTFRCVTYASRGYPPSEVPPEQERYNYLRQAVVRCAAAALGAVVLGGALAGCSGRAAPGQAEISASAPVALADQAIAIEVTGLPSGQRATVTANATDDTGLTWQSDATVTATRQGVVNLAASVPDSGSYQGADAIVYPNAGHAVGTFPYQPITTAAIDILGGARAGDVAAQQAGWSKVLGLLAQLSR